MPWERSVAMSWTPQMRWVDQSGKAQQTFEQLKLRFRFNEEAAARLFKGAEREFDSVRSNIEAATVPGFALPGLLTLSATTGLRRTESVNVVAVLPGSDPKLKHEYIVISAHLDHLGRGPSVNGDAIYNGAHDNAVGVGIMLEMARALNLSNTRPRRSLLFVAVTAEEKGTAWIGLLRQAAASGRRRDVGSEHQHGHADAVHTYGGSGRHGRRAFDARHGSAQRGTQRGLPSQRRSCTRRSLVHTQRPIFVYSAGDSRHRAGRREQARDSRLNAAELKREYRAKHYHQPSDDLSLPMDFDAAAGLARVDLRLLLDIANAPARPTWKPDDFFAGKFPVKASP